MEKKLTIYNTMSRQKEEFSPLKPPFVGLYVCGPTVYGDAHLGHARPAITFDVLFRYLKYSGYKVRYVRNITDVGHLTNDSDDGDDKILAKAQLEKVEPMEIVQFYTNRYHKNMEQLNTLEPSIEPHASGHIIEQQALVKKILENGYAYESEGNIYFDVEAYSKKHDYGKLSGRKLDEQIANTRQLDGQQEKRNPADFALWKKASPAHIMRWPSPWGDGFPGWHLECSCMSQKYLGDVFDIHGGGLDLQFPHHECEIAQSTAAYGHEAVRYWMHNNMVTIKGQKMGKSLGNFVTLDQLFSGENKVLEQAYSPMTVRFFILQAHYRSPLDFSNDALKAAEKGYERLMAAVEALDKIAPSAKTTVNIKELTDRCFEAINDDMNTPILISHLFDGVRIINSIAAGTEQIDEANLAELKKLYHDFVFDILGLKTEAAKDSKSNAVLGKVLDIVMESRNEAKKNKDWATSDRIRDNLKQAGVVVKDTKDGYEWTLE
ncbi:cysteine--tRNA ligase [Porphyromonadaceae bacterium OttesenSCG-928-L07]|nr:cysteine--tRNA ligase [Porphyromonadaceae bacterium OttesenSCG-928-L07]